MIQNCLIRREMAKKSAARRFSAVAAVQTQSLNFHLFSDKNGQTGGCLSGIYSDHID